MAKAKPDLMRASFVPNPVMDEAAVQEFRKRLNEFGAGWRQPIILTSGTRITRMNRWQRLRYRVASWITPRATTGRPSCRSPRPSRCS